MLFGAGQLFVRSLDLDATTLRGENLIAPLCIASFELTPDDTLAEAKCLLGGKKQIAAAAVTETIYTLKLSFEYVDWGVIQLVFDELASNTASAVLPVLKTATVPTGNEIIDTALTSATGVFVYRSTPKPPIYYEIITTGTPTAEQVKVDTALTKLVFPTGSAGSVVQYVHNQTYTTIQTIGVEDSFDGFGALSFSGIVSGTEFSQGMQIVCPRIYRISSPTLTINGDLATIDIEFRAAVAPGDRLPYKLYELST